ncbi:hypothetical protein AgCh_025322 [Apium graveolens]
MVVHFRIDNRQLTMSAEELKIRRELEMDVEKELAAEIKDEICNLSLRLIQLYQQQKEREAKESSQIKALSKVNINNRMQGGTEVEIVEAKKNVRRTSPRPKLSSKVESNAPKPPKLSEENTRRRVISESRKKFDWVKTLRSGTSSVASHQHKVPKNTARMWDDNVQIVGINGTKCIVHRR